MSIRGVPCSSPLTQKNFRHSGCLQEAIRVPCLLWHNLQYSCSNTSTCSTTSVVIMQYSPRQYMVGVCCLYPAVSYISSSASPHSPHLYPCLFIHTYTHTHIHAHTQKPPGYLAISSVQFSRLVVSDSRNCIMVVRAESHWETDSFLENSERVETKQSLYHLCSDLQGNFRNQLAFTKYFSYSIYFSRESNRDNIVYFCSMNNSVSICCHRTQQMLKKYLANDF